ncbi:fungal-specific transcription factor domain-containing protein [Aspergillus cavernicola]|uniref:Fungal-specific transcription factor domain-containing protein n=1 Tax=Aspergillus cavernicola TaxID=176166 RepID=A0ABR4IZA0_9EURO
MGIAQKIFELGKQHMDEQATSAIPGYRASTSALGRRTAVADQRLPISTILNQQMPSMDLVYVLLEDYFEAVHWFSLVVYEPNFRKKLHSIADGLAYPSQKPFLLLLAVMLGMGAWYRSQRSITNTTDKGVWRNWSVDLFKLVELHLVELMDQPSVTAAQICILFGSHHVYHGRPNLSFSLLGATIKISQAAGLHREPLKGDFEEIEERKRVWWTIYTWDRFASITYGRPLGINDKDCNLSMPADVFENPYFIAPRSEQRHTVCYSTYQRELNSLYLISAPALEAIFSSRTSGSSRELAGDAYLKLVKEATENIQRWRSQLPDHLISELERDISPHSRLSARAHALQSLSLQLTYDNILIVLHRPLLVRQVDHLSTTHGQSPGRSAMDFPIHSTAAATSQQNISFEAVSPGVPIKSPVHWWNAALRTSRVAELPLLAQLATDSHLVAFLAINLFNAAIVLAVMALSDPLSDTAQVVKRTITRILRLQDVLGRRSALSKQSTSVLKNVVTLLLRRESEAMLAPIAGRSQDEGNTLAGNSLMSVEDTLRLPLDATVEASSDPPSRGQAWPDLSRAHRLNESLASVQYVLPPGDDQFLGLQAGGDNQPPTLFPDMRPDEEWQMSTPQVWSQANAPPETVDHTPDVNGERGLYWLWDMSWNGGPLNL